MGSLDWITTIVGIVGFGAVEGNPFLAGLVGTNLLAFTAIKLGTAIFAGLLFYQAERILNSVADKGSKAFRAVRLVLKGAYVGSVLFLVFAVMNNVWAAYAATIA
jgi:hypothetical protein